MSKGIIVLDMPYTCAECRFWKSFAGITSDCSYYNKEVDANSKPEWCPIKPITEEGEI